MPVLNLEKYKLLRQVNVVLFLQKRIGILSWDYREVFILIQHSPYSPTQSHFIFVSFQVIVFNCLKIVNWSTIDMVIFLQLQKMFLVSQFYKLSEKFHEMDSIGLINPPSKIGLHIAYNTLAQAINFSPRLQLLQIFIIMQINKIKDRRSHQMDFQSCFQPMGFQPIVLSLQFV